MKNTFIISRRSTQILKAALSALYYIGVDGLAAPSTSGDGVTFMLHRVSPEPVRAFEPNRILKITPDFLDNVVRRAIEAGIDLLSMDEVPERLAARRSARPFACFTLVDGYRDNLEYALPIFKRYGARFTVYVPTDYMDGKGDLWWLTLKHAIEASDSIRVMNRWCGAALRHRNRCRQGLCLRGNLLAAAQHPRGAVSQGHRDDCGRLRTARRRVVP